MNVGRKVWVIAEGYIPGHSTHPEDRRLVSHETVCMLNAGDVDAQVSIFAYFADREPVGPYRAVVPARRTLHLRLSDLSDPAPIPADTDYATVIVASVPIVAQHTRLDSREAALALMTTIAYSE
jgi:hypothetical protein